ncbi:hypothetical protein GCM10025855_30320 [Shewanella glacialipiscicola]|uniref:Uncharacterized protein n=1 Tax=Shewanella glacialipiscicola TaxID=614069 RepID=A0ABQ6J7K7_9GAMM|nr:hypothetical protein GCM10025855_30320 [Shewanella glacialipiscicola]
MATKLKLRYTQKRKLLTGFYLNLSANAGITTLAYRCAINTILNYRAHGIRRTTETYATSMKANHIGGTQELETLAHVAVALAAVFNGNN